MSSRDRPTDKRIARELTALAPSFAAFARYYGRAPSVCRLPDAPTEAWVVRYPRLPVELEAPFRVWLELPSFFRTDAFADLFDALGFAADDDGVVRQVPTPASFVSLFAARLGRAPGYAPEVITVDALRVPPRDWFEGYALGRVRTNAPTVGLHRLFALPLRMRRPHRAWCAHLTALGHDMSIHALPLSMIGADQARAIGDRARRAAAAIGGESGQGALVTFFEEDLSQHALDVWRAVRGEPTEFEAAFDASFPKLLEALERAEERGIRERRRRRRRLEVLPLPALLRSLVAFGARRLR